MEVTVWPPEAPAKLEEATEFGPVMTEVVPGPIFTLWKEPGEPPMVEMVPPDPALMVVVPLGLLTTPELPAGTLQKGLMTTRSRLLCIRRDLRITSCAEVFLKSCDKIDLIIVESI